MEPYQIYFALLANQLRDILNDLEETILSRERFKRTKLKDGTWKVDKLTPLESLIFRLEKLSEPPQPPTMFQSVIGGTEE